MKVSKFRDLTIIDLNKDQFMVVACDSSGGIGNKKEDVVKVNPEVVGYYTTQVALMEIIAIGATPVTIVNALAVEMDPTGQGIIKGVKRAIAPLKLDESQIITGSTEENIPVCQTAMGITIIGIMDKDEFQKTKAQSGDIIVAVGVPKMGDDLILDNGKETMSIELLLELKNYISIREILPVGSKGILYEAGEMARTNNLEHSIVENVEVDIHKSAGPGTCVIIALNENDYMAIKRNFPIPLNKIGKFL